MRFGAWKICLSRLYRPNIKISFILLLWVALLSTANALGNHTKREIRQGRAERCNPLLCQIPDCFCGGDNIPGGFTPEQTPQFVLLTFDDAVNVLNRKFYEDLFPGRFNPNGCPIKATFYVSHEWTDYEQVRDLYAAGHEIASHTITHSHGTNFGEEKWAEEIVGEAENLVELAGVNPLDIKGMRAPFLAGGGDTMFNALGRYGFYYDSSMPTGSPSWPYSLDYLMPHGCNIDPCPVQSHPGMWEVPMKTLKDVRGGSCSMADGCVYTEKADHIQKIFTQNFLEHYTKSRAPFPLFFHSAWFHNRSHRKEGFLAFLDTILALPDVYFVTSQELIAWTRFPEPLPQVHSSSVFHCDFPDRPKATRKVG